MLGDAQRAFPPVQIDILHVENKKIYAINGFEVTTKEGCERNIESRLF